MSKTIQNMKYRWSFVEVGEVCDLIVDCINKTAPTVDYKTPYRMVRTTNIRNGRIDLSDCKYVEKDIFEKWTRRAKVKAGDVLLTREAPIGEVGYVTENDTIFLGQRIMQYRANPNFLDSRFLLYAFLSPTLQRQFGSHEGSGSVVSHIRVGDCDKFKIPLPPLSEQRAIAHILGTLDDKIELNQRMNQTLEEIAQAIFKSWFVDFEPVKAKQQAREAGKSSAEIERAAMATISGSTIEQLDQLPKENYQKLAETAALFPDEFEDSELGFIPKGWEFREAQDVTDISIGKTPPRKENQWFSRSRSDIPWVSVRDLGNSGIYIYETSEYLTEEATNKFKIIRVPDNSILLSFKLTIGRIAITVGEMLTNEAIAHLKISSKSPLSTEFLYCYLKSFDFNSLGSTSSIAQAVNSKIVKQIPVLVPNRELSNVFSEKITPLFKAIKNYQLESSKLTQIQDTLLPKLLSGEITVPEAETQVEETLTH